MNEHYIPGSRVWRSKTKHAWSYWGCTLADALSNPSIDPDTNYASIGTPDIKHLYSGTFAELKKHFTGTIYMDWVIVATDPIDILNYKDKWLIVPPDSEVAISTLRAVDIDRTNK